MPRQLALTRAIVGDELDQAALLAKLTAVVQPHLAAAKH